MRRGYPSLQHRSFRFRTVLHLGCAEVQDDIAVVCGVYWKC